MIRYITYPEQPHITYIEDVCGRELGTVTMRSDGYVARGPRPNEAICGNRLVSFDEAVSLVLAWEPQELAT